MADVKDQGKKQKKAETNSWVHIESTVQQTLSLAKRVWENARTQTSIAEKMDSFEQIEQPAHVIFSFGTVALIYPRDTEFVDYSVDKYPMHKDSVYLMQRNMDRWTEQKTKHKLVRQGFETLITDGFPVAPCDCDVRTLVLSCLSVEDAAMEDKQEDADTSAAIRSSPKFNRGATAPPPTKTKSFIVQFPGRSSYLFNMCFRESNVTAAASSTRYLRRMDYMFPSVYALITAGPEFKLIRMDD